MSQRYRPAKHVSPHAYRRQGVLIPTIEEIDVLDLARIRWILVIEKEVRVSATLVTLTKCSRRHFARSFARHNGMQ
jgi:hypothetical protein